MLPPMLPLSAVPITSQQDPIRQRPDIPPVVPVQESSNESTIDLQKRDPEEDRLLAREEQRRQQERDRRRREADEDPEEHLAVPGTVLNADNTVPVVPLIEINRVRACGSISRFERLWLDDWFDCVGLGGWSALTAGGIIGAVLPVMWQL